MNRINTCTLLATIAALLFATVPQAFAQESTVRTGVFYRLGKAFNRTITSKPRARQSNLDMATRAHYATNVYAYEGQADQGQHVAASHGLFIHWKLDDPNRKANPGHALAE